MKTVKYLNASPDKILEEQPTTLKQRFYMNNNKINHSPRYFLASFSMSPSCYIGSLPPAIHQCQKDSPRFTLFCLCDSLYFYVMFLLLQSSQLQHCLSFSPDFLSFYEGQGNTSEIKIESDDTPLPEEIKINYFQIYM